MMRIYETIVRDIKNTKQELYALQAKLERLEEEQAEAIKAILEKN